MRADTLGAQFRRIGALAAVAVIAATALGTFALLQRVVPGSASSAAVTPATLTPRTPGVSATPSPTIPTTGPSTVPSVQQTQQNAAALDRARSRRLRALTTRRTGMTRSTAPTPGGGTASNPSGNSSNGTGAVAVTGPK
ncbi:MAG: hypothetical protein ACLP01_05525 [Solirubrobacteraceae bacterium]